MSTHARIGILNSEDGTVTSVYSHFDGYPEHHYPILCHGYYEASLVRELLALGDLSWLGDSPAECFAYGRDRGEEGTGAITHPLDRWPDDHRWRYLFLPASGWTVNRISGGIPELWIPADGSGSILA